jgi:7-carboxy-7-deazaguanine synthase
MAIKIQEIFTQTIQGEGARSGWLSDFVRLYGCPVGCPWCDTGYGEVPEPGIGFFVLDVDDIVKQLPSPHIVVTGGEPLLQDDSIALFKALLAAGKLVSVETSGTFLREIPRDVWVTFSPKDHVSRHYKSVSDFWGRSNEIKIVISDPGEFELYADRVRPWIGKKPVSVQPCDRLGVSPKEAFLPVLEILKRYPGVRASVQTHKFIGVR